jgi:hypothetical protein
MSEPISINYIFPSLSSYIPITIMIVVETSNVNARQNAVSFYNSPLPSFKSQYLPNIIPTTPTLQSSASKFDHGFPPHIPRAKVAKIPPNARSRIWLMGSRLLGPNLLAPLTIFEGKEVATLPVAVGTVLSAC